MVSHADKDCTIWLSSKGSLKVEDQQFGHWIRATLVNPSRKSVMDVKGFEKKDTHSCVSSFSDASSSSMQEGILALKSIPETVVEADCNTRADSKTAIEFSPVAVAKQRERLQVSEERLQVVIANLEEDANTKGFVTLLGNKHPAVTNIINEPNVSSIPLRGEGCVTNLDAVRTMGSNEKEVCSVVQVSKDIGIKFDIQSVMSSQTLSSLSSQGDKDGHSNLNTFGPALGQEGHQMGANLVRASEADFTTGWVDDVMVHEGNNMHIGTVHMALPTAKVKVEHVKQGGLKKGRWTRLSSRVGIDKLQSTSLISSGIKRNISGTYEAMVEDTETEKKLKLDTGPDEQSDYLASHLGSVEAVDQPRQVQ